MKYINRNETIALILEAVNHNTRATQTRIMYEAYLTHIQLKEYLFLLLKKGLIRYQKGDRISFTITEKGIHFLQVYNQNINNMFEDSGLNLINQALGNHN